MSDQLDAALAKIADWERRSESCESKLGQLEANERVMVLEQRIKASQEQEPALWVWRHGADDGVLTLRADYIQHKTNWPDMQFKAYYPVPATSPEVQELQAEIERLKSANRNEVTRLSCIIEMHIDCMTWMLRETGILGADEIPGAYWKSACLIDSFHPNAAGYAVIFEKYKNWLTQI